jgi:hypothetical protein
LIHLALADISHDDGRFFASQKMLASKGRCSIEYVRKVINQMVEEGHIKIISKGNSRGKATTYQLLWKKLPNSVGEALPIEDDELPNSDTPHSPTMEVSLPNSTPYHPSYTSVLSTTKSDETAIAVIALSEAVARKWWEKQRVKPLGKNAWHSLLAICQAAEKRGYTAEHIEQALDYIGTVPSMRQMDLVLRGVGVKTKHEQSAIRAVELAEKLKNEIT